jgi:hypothetical protein
MIGIIGMSFIPMYKEVGPFLFFMALQEAEYEYI